MLVNDRLLDQRRMVVATNLTQREMAGHLGHRLASRLYANNPKLGEVRLVVNTGFDYRRPE